MARPALLETLHTIAEPVVHSLGLSIWGIDILPTGRPVVRIYVDAPPSCATENTYDEHLADTTPPVDADSPTTDDASTPCIHAASIDQCAKISRMVGLAMEVEEVFASAYVLEVSSPGFSRMFFHLAQMHPYVGDTVETLLIAALPHMRGRKKFRGELVSVGETDFTVRTESEDGMTDVCIAWDDVRKVSRVHIFITPEKPGKKRKAT